MASTTCTPAGWADLPLDLLVGVIARLVFPGDRARSAAVCRPWRSAARELVMNHQDHLPWVVLPTGTVCTAAGCSSSFFPVPGFLGGDTTTCLGAAHDCWLALDRTDDVLRRTPAGVQFVHARRDVKHRHSYTLHNPFSNATVPLPELDAVIGHVAETFQVRKVLMRSPAPDDIIAVTTNNCNYNIVLLRPGKGYFVLDEFRVVDVAFLGETLYGITSGEELLSFRLGEDKDGRPNVTRIELAIKNLSAKYYHEEFPWTWPYDVVDHNTDKRVSHDDGHNNNHSGEVSEDLDDDGEEESGQEENDDNIEEENQEEDINENDELAYQALFEYSSIDDGTISDNETFDGFADGDTIDHRFSQDVPYDGKDELRMGRYLVLSRSGELLLVRHQWQLCTNSRDFTRKVEVLKADFSVGRWAAASDELTTKAEAIFLSQSYSKCTRARGDIQKGFVYYAAAYLNDVFDMTSCTSRSIKDGWQWQYGLKKLAWLFPPEIVV